MLSVLTNRLLYPFLLAGLFLRKLIRRLFKLFPDGDAAGFGFTQHLPRVFRKAGGDCIRLPSFEKQQVLVRPGFIKGIVHIPLPGHPVKCLRVPGKLNAVCSRAVSHELFHALPAVGRLVFPVSLADLPAHSPQHIGKAPRR